MAPRKHMFKLPENVHVYIFVAIAMAGIIASTTYISQQLINRATAEEKQTEIDYQSISGVVESSSSTDVLPDRSTTVKAENTDSIINRITESVLEKKKKKKSPVF